MIPEVVRKAFKLAESEKPGACHIEVPEDVAEEIQSNYGLPNKVSFNARACGEPNAYYDDQSIEVIFCYELFQDLLRLISEDMPEDVIPTSTAGRVGPQSD